MMLYGLKSTTEKANVTTESVLTFSNKFAEFDETNFDDSSGSEATDMTTQEAMFYCLPAQHLSRDKKIAMHEILCNSECFRIGIWRNADQHRCCIFRELCIFLLVLCQKRHWCIN